MIEPGRITLIAEPGSLLASLHGLSVSTVNPSDLPPEPARVAQRIATTGCDVAVLGADLPVDHALAVAAELAATFPEVEIVALATPSEGVLARAMAAGVGLVLAPDVGGDALRAGVERLATTSALRRSRLQGSPAAEEAGPANGRVITVMAAKGGVGKSTIAVNVAAELARAHADQVVLVDADLTAGEVDLLLGIEPTSTLASVAHEGAVVDSAVVKLALSSHATGLLVLAAPTTLIDADAVDPDLIVEVLDTLRRSFRYVVVDTAPGAGAALAAAVQAADDVLAVASPDLGGLRSLRRNLDGLQTLGLDRARFHLVVNRADQRTGVTNQAIESNVELPIAQSIPESKEVATNANQGVPLVRANPRSETTRALKALSARLA